MVHKKEAFFTEVECQTNFWFGISLRISHDWLQIREINQQHNFIETVD
jgi:hypothetical protein